MSDHMLPHGLDDIAHTSTSVATSCQHEPTRVPRSRQNSPGAHTMTTCVKIQNLNMDWALGALGAAPARGKDGQRSIVVHMGGFCELLYWALRHDEKIDLTDELDIVVDAFEKALGRS